MKYTSEDNDNFQQLHAFTEDKKKARYAYLYAQQEEGDRRCDPKKALKLLGNYNFIRLHVLYVFQRASIQLLRKFWRLKILGIRKTRKKLVPEIGNIQSRIRCFMVVIKKPKKYIHSKSHSNHGKSFTKIPVLKKEGFN